MNPHPARAIALLSVLVAAAAGCQARSSNKTNPIGAASADKNVVTVFAAASTTDAMEEIKAAFVRKTGADVETSYAATSTLAQQIASGAEADLFLSANVSWADHVQGKAAVQKRRNLLSNHLVVIVGADSMLKLERPGDLLSNEVEYLALGDPDAVPAGKYARQALTNLNLWEDLKGKVVPAQDVRDALTYVETGAAEAGIVYATDAAVSDKVRVVMEISPELTDPVLYPLLFLKRSKENRSAEDFYEFLISPEAGRIFEKFGFVVIGEAGGDAGAGNKSESSSDGP